MKTNCCRKTAVSIWDQVLNFSIQELVRSQSTSSTDPEVLQNWTAFIQFCSLCAAQQVKQSANFVHAVLGLTPSMMCTYKLCVVCIGLLSADFSTVNTGLGRPMFWKPLCLLSTPEGLATTNYQVT